MIPDMMETYKMPYLSSYRASFHKTLLDAAKKRGIQIKMGCIISSIDFEASSVTLEDGRAFHGDLVLGADGAISQCRSLLLGRPDPPYHFGHMMFSIEVSQDALRARDDLRHLIDTPGVPYWLGPGSMCLATGIRENNTFNLLGGIPEPDTNAIITHPQPCDLNSIKNYYMHWEPMHRKLLDLAPFCLKWTLTATHELKEWLHPRGKFALLGDSAHSMTPYL